MKSIEQVLKYQKHTLLFSFQYFMYNTLCLLNICKVLTRYRQKWSEFPQLCLLNICKVLTSGDREP